MGVEVIIMIWTLPPIFTLCLLRGAPFTPIFQGPLSSGNSSGSQPMTPAGQQLGHVMESMVFQLFSGVQQEWNATVERTVERVVDASTRALHARLERFESLFAKMLANSNKSEQSKD